MRTDENSKISTSLTQHRSALQYYCLLPWYPDSSLSLVPHPLTINRIISQKIRKRRIEEENKEITQDHTESL